MSVAVALALLLALGERARGAFTDSGQALGSSSTQAVALGDVDGDGDLDIVTGNRSQPNRVWLNDGAGTFADSGQALGSSNTWGVALGDVDGDGDLDIVAGNDGQANRVWLNDGAGTFADSGQALGSSSTFAALLGDVDSDGDLDIVAGNYNSQPNRAWLNDGAGTFTDSGQTLGGSSTFGAALGDVDGDGDLDIVAANYSQANRVWTNDGSGAFTDSGQALGTNGTLAVALGDVDGDGDFDIVAGNWSGQGNRVWLNDGAGTFADSGQSLGSSDTYDVALGDVDGDGDLDIVVGNGGQANRVWINDGAGSFTDSGEALGSSGTIAVALGDVDGDGDLDIVAGNWSGQANRVWINDSASNSPPSVTITSPADGASFAAGADVTITASANDTDGTITQVEFFRNGTSIGLGTDVGGGSWSITWTGVPEGAYALTAIATDDGGATTESAPVNVVVGTIVSIQATQDAAEPSTDGLFTVTRSGDTTSAITVGFALDAASTATEGVGNDFTLSPAASVDFAAGETVKTITVIVQDDSTNEATETVIVDLQPGVGYGLGSPSTASVSITDDDLVEILTFVLYADTSASGEYQHTLTAISTYFTDYVETSTVTTDPAALATELAGKDVFLIPEQETSGAGILGPLGTSWATVLTNFVTNGGTVIACSWTMEEHLILNNSGLMSLSRTGGPASASVETTTPHLLTEGVTSPFTGSYVATYSTVTDGSVVLQTVSGSEPVVIYRDIGAGHAVMIGTDYFTLGTDFDRIVANAVQWAASIAVSCPNGGETWYQGDAETITWSSGGVTGNVDIHYSTDGGGTWTAVATDIPDGGSYVWTVPGEDSPVCLVRVQETGGAGLSDTSDAAFTISPPGITVTAPDGGEVWYQGFTETITWTAGGFAGNVDVHYSADGGSSWTSVATNVPDTGSYSWTVPAEDSAVCLVRVQETGGAGLSDESDAVFTIAPPPPEITVTEPSSSVTVDQGQPVTISWTGAYGTGVSLWYDLDSVWGNGNETAIAAAQPQSGSYSWVTTLVPAGTYYIVGVNTDGTSDVSDYAPGTVTVTLDDHGDNAAFATAIALNTDVGGDIETGSDDDYFSFAATAGVEYTIETALGTLGDTVLYLYDQDGTTQLDYDDDGGPGLASLIVWTCPAAGTYYVRVRSYGSGTGTYTVAVNCPFAVTCPNGGEVWYQGDSETVTWAAGGIAGGVDIHYSADSGGTWTVIAVAAADTGSYTWTVPGEDSPLCLVRVQETGGAGLSDTSDAVFTISPPGITVTAPAGGEVWYQGSTETITWTAGGFAGNLDIHYSTDGGASWTAVATDTADTGSYAWTVPVEDSADCLVRVQETGGAGESDTSDGAFTIAPLPCASFPFVEDFETGALADYWSVNSTGTGRALVATTNGPNAGAYHFLMDSSVDGSYSLNELVLTIDLSGAANVIFSFYHKEFSDETHSMPVSFTGSTNSDGVAVSADGVTWYRAVALGGATSFYQLFDVDLDALCSASGITYNSRFRIKFQQYDNFRITTDGFAFDDITVDFLRPPTITTHPSAVTVTEPATATFTVVATGTAPLTYQWRKDGVDIPGATASSYTTPPTVMADDGAVFTCVVTNTVGSATSNPATLWVSMAPPSITTHPSDQTVYEGDTASFSVVATGTTPLSYQWRRDGVDIAGATSSDYTTPPTVLADDGAVFTCVVTNPRGTVTSNPATLTVEMAVPPSITTQPSDQIVTEGQTATFSVVATGPGTLTYQWRKDGVDIAGATSSSYTTPPTVLAEDGSFFTCIVTNAGGSVTSDAAILWVDMAPPSIVTHPSDQTAFEGETATFDVVATGTAPITYQWRRGGTDIPGATASSYTTPPTVLADDGAVFTCVVTNPRGTVTSNPATLTVRPAFVTVNTPNGGETWYYQGPDQVITWTSGGVPGNVDIQYSADGGSTWTAAATDIANTGSHTWTIPDENSAACLVRVQGTGGVGPADESDAVFTIAPAVITLTVPNGGEAWDVGSSQAISWTSSGVANVRIELSRDGGTTWEDILASTDAAAGTYDWTVTGPESADCLVRVSDAADGSPADRSDLAFTVAGIAVTSPNGGETWGSGTVQATTWNSAGVANVRIELSRDGGSTWEDIVASTDATAGTYDWAVTAPPSADCLIRVSDAVDGSPADQSDVAFAIAGIAVSAPNGGETWYYQGADQTITWTSVGIAGNVRIRYSTDGGASWKQIVANAPNTGSYLWTIPNENSAACLVRVQEAGGGGLGDVSDAPFTIAPASITVTSPNGAETWHYQGADQAVTWTSVGIAGNVDIHYSADGGGTWTAVALDIADTGSYTWAIPDANSAACVVRVGESGGGGPSDVSDAPFTIAQVTITVTSPDGLEIWTVGDSQNIVWTSSSVVDVKIELSRDGGSTWEEIVASTDAAAGTYPWTVTGPGSTNCLVRVSDAADAPNADVSDAGFRITPPSVPGVIYVDKDATGAGDGTSWVDAYADLQPALAAAASGDEIWVAEGTYKPTSGADRATSFTLVDGVALYGGFAGIEAARAERDWVVNAATLSADIGVAGDNADNSYHVVVGASNATLDGFTVTGGNANGSATDGRGGGMYNRDASSLSIANCTFSGSLAFIGGGVYNWGCSPTVSNCIFSGNTAYGGGGMYNITASPAVTNCSFSGNTATGPAGSGGGGGGMSNLYSSSPTVTDCTFSANTASPGGGIYHILSSPTVTNCIFTGNTADWGGGIYSYNSSSTVTNCTFSGNGANRCGGGMYIATYSSTSITNSVLWGDSAPTGPEIYETGLSSCTVDYSNIGQVGGFTDSGGNTNADPLFVDADGPDDIPGTPDDNLDLLPGSPCIDAAEGSVAPAADIEGNARWDDPGTVDLGTGAPTYADMGAYEFQGITAGAWLTVWNPPAGVWLKPGVDLEIRWLAWGDVGDVSAVKIELSRDGGAAWELIAASTPNDTSHIWTITDGGQPLPQQDCRIRVSDAADDVPSGVSGSFAIFDGVRYVDADAPGPTRDGLSWATAFLHPQDAVDAASSGNEIRVAEGTYVRRSGSDTVVLTMKDGIVIYGGYAGYGQPDPDERDPVSHATILEGENTAYHVVVSASNAALDGFILAGGNANGGSWDNYGAGICNDGVTGLTVANCVFTSNAAVAGAGMYNRQASSLSVVNCAFSGNTAGSNGGGMYNHGFYPSVADCTFSGNTAGSNGGGMYNFDYGSPAVTNCTFSGNAAGARGGGMYNFPSASPSLANCTFSGNTAGGDGGGIFNFASASITVTNSILWADSAPTGPEIHNDGTSSCTVTYSDVGQAGGFTDGGGNINADPLFVDADGADDIPGTADDDLHLQAGSPCIDAADGDAAPALDIEGNARQDDSGMDDVGVGTPTFVDMGACEFQGTSTPVITVTAPAGGEVWDAGALESVTWTTSGGRVLSVRIELTRDGGATWEYIDGGAPVAGAASLNWTVTGPPSPDCYVRVSDTLDGNPADGSDAAFTIMEDITVTLSLSAVAEGDGTLTAFGTVSVLTAPASPLIVTLASDDATEATVPAQVTIPAGLTSVDFDVTIVDDTVIDGDQTVTISASATAYVPGSDSMLVNDNETQTVTVTLPVSATEGDGTLTGGGSVSIPAICESGLVIDLQSSDTTELTLPATVAIPQGDVSATFDLAIIDDGEIDGPETVVVTPTLAGWMCVADSMDVLDNDTQAITVTLPASATEGDGTLAGAGTVSIPGVWATDLVISLRSSRPTELTVPATVTILQGSTSAAFDIAVPDGGAYEGTRTVTVTATRAGWTPGSADMDLLDNDQRQPESPFGGGCAPGPSGAHASAGIGMCALIACLALRRRRRFSRRGSRELLVLVEPID